MKAICINTCFGGFGLSEQAYKEMNMLWDGYGHADDVKRDDPKLIATVRKLGRAANGRYAKLKVVEIPDDAEWIIEEYDGMKHVAEKHRTWN